MKILPYAFVLCLCLILVFVFILCAIWISNTDVAHNFGWTAVVFGVISLLIIIFLAADE